MVGSLKVDWLGDWAMVGHGRHRHAGVARSDQEGSDDGRVGPIARATLVDLPVYAGIEVRNLTAAVAFLAGARAIVDQAAPGIDPVGRGRARARRSVRGGARRWGVRRGDQGRRALLRVLQERARAVAERIGAAPPHRRLPRRPPAAHAVGDRRGRPAVDLRPGHARARAAVVAAGVHGRQRAIDGRARAGRRPPRRRCCAAPPARRRRSSRMLARDTLGAIPVTPEGYAYAARRGRLARPVARRAARWRQAGAGRSARQRGIALRPPGASHLARAQRGGVRRRARRQGDGRRGRRNRPAVCTSSCDSSRRRAAP